MKIFIICRDRLEPLLQLLPWIEGNEIYLVDNDSKYKPLLKFYEENSDKYNVINTGKNFAHRSPWILNLVPKDERYVVTDPDVVPDKDCPKDFLKVMSDILDAAPDVQKVGFGLRIDDLPDHYAHKESIIKHERGFWGCRRDILGYEGHEVPIDTTFAMYREGINIGRYGSPATDVWPAIRLGMPYVAQHLAWYVDSSKPTKEDVFYKARANKQIANWLFDSVSESHK